MGTKKTDPLAKLDKLTTDVCLAEADDYKRREQTTRSQAMCYGEGVRMGFVAGYVARHYIRPSELGIDDPLEAIKERHPKLHKMLEAMLEDSDLEDLFDEAPEEHTDEDSEP
jgi:hypothetical protein